MSWDLTDGRDLKYISPEDHKFRWLSHLNDVIVLPLEWPEVDAFYYLKKVRRPLKVDSGHDGLPAIPGNT